MLRITNLKYFETQKQTENRFKNDLISEEN